MKSDSGVTTAVSERSQRVGGAGFTLVEVMVAIALLSLILLTTITALRTLGNTQGSIERLTNRVDEVRTVSTFMRDLLESTVVGGGPSAIVAGPTSGLGESYFVFGADFLELKATVLFGELFGGSYLVRMAKEENRLVLRWQEPPPDQTQPQWLDTPSRVVIENLEEFTVATRKAYADDWTETMDKDDMSTPALVRLRVKAAGRYWPDLVVQMLR